MKRHSFAVGVVLIGEKNNSLHQAPVLLDYLKPILQARVSRHFVSMEKRYRLQSKPEFIRNVCIMAHVDHGKTSLADLLIATNGIISDRMAGKLRYMDSRIEEQERGITMKSSAISLIFENKGKSFLINLVDSPGHADFSGEVSAAAVLCDGVILVIDVVEGVCPQTIANLRLAWKEDLQLCLVLNKIDRLFTEMKMTPLEAYNRLVQVLEQANAVTGELFVSRELEDYERLSSSSVDANNSGNGNSSGAPDEEKHYFVPSSGNVAFASALDNWAFRLSDFAELWAKRLTCIDEQKLCNALWGDFYLDAKSKQPVHGASEKGKEPLFASMVLRNLASVYDAFLISGDADKAMKILKSLQISIQGAEVSRSDPRQKLQSVFGSWIPAASAVLRMVCDQLPPAGKLSQRRIERLLCGGSASSFRLLSPAAQALKPFIMNCTVADAPTIVFVSKMVPVESRLLDASIRKQATEMHYFIPDESTPCSANYVFVAFARVFTGKLVKGQKLYVIPSSSNGTHANGVEAQEVTIGDLFIMMGREYEPVESVCAGNLVCVAGVEKHILKSATLSTSLDCPSLCSLKAYAEPIVRVSVEPQQASDLPTLISGLKLLSLADPCVKAFVEDTGEHVLVTVGEMHLQRCLDDLHRRFAAGIDLKVSAPIVPFAETIIPPPEVDLANEIILPTQKPKRSSIVVRTTSQSYEFKLKALPLPLEIQQIIERNQDLLNMIDPCTNRLKVSSFPSEGTDVCQVRHRFSLLLNELKEAFMRQDSMWHGIEEKVWAFGPKKASLNMLINAVEDYNRPSVFDILCEDSVQAEYKLRQYDQSLVTGFHLRCRAGPMCDEPIRGVAFFVEDWNDLNPEATSHGESCDAHIGQIINSVKDGLRLAFEAQPQRLVMPMYTCTIQATGEVLGKVHAVLNRRGGKVFREELKDSINLFEVCASLPVVESFGFAEELRKRASGLAWPQLVFSHWEIFPVDPFWVPTTEEEVVHYGEMVDNVNLAKKYVNAVRRRKGLPVKEKLVLHAEKQRTLARKV
ncbi:elongation factor Tu GTP binding [Trichuris trichiura]|uniref:Ribosome assembly protein 1 n=1 Tax=Trichuris trichiura TaxID=36087 RepID=A0A077ZDZ9_TRITR|nr:elongation factor Tu GTP binding [Trichuris trichiura]